MMSGKALKFYQCTICSNVFEEPVDLPCGHTFCSKCITSLYGPKKLACQLCSFEMEVPENEKVGFPADTKMKAFVSVLNKEKEALSCQTCLVKNVTELAKHICMDCPVRKYFCDNCLEGHKLFCEDHSVVQLSEYLKGHGAIRVKPIEPCIRHDKKKMEKVCLACRSLLCITCSSEDNCPKKTEAGSANCHHEPVALSTAGADCLEELKKALPQSQAMRKVVNNYKEMHENYIETLTHAQEKAQNEIVRNYKVLVNALKRGQELLVQRVNQSVDDHRAIAENCYLRMKAISLDIEKAQLISTELIALNLQGQAIPQVANLKMALLTPIPNFEALPCPVEYVSSIQNSPAALAKDCLGFLKNVGDEKLSEKAAEATVREATYESKSISSVPTDHGPLLAENSLSTPVSDSSSLNTQESQLIVSSPLSTLQEPMSPSVKSPSARHGVPSNTEHLLPDSDVQVHVVVAELEKPCLVGSPSSTPSQPSFSTSKSDELKTKPTELCNIDLESHGEEQSPKKVAENAEDKLVSPSECYNSLTNLQYHHLHHQFALFDSVYVESAGTFMVGGPDGIHRRTEDGTLQKVHRSWCGGLAVTSDKLYCTTGTKKLILVFDLDKDGTLKFTKEIFLSSAKCLRGITCKESGSLAVVDSSSRQITLISKSSLVTVECKNFVEDPAYIDHDKIRDAIFYVSDCKGVTCVSVSPPEPLWAIAIDRAKAITVVNEYIYVAASGPKVLLVTSTGDVVSEDTPPEGEALRVLPHNNLTVCYTRVARNRDEAFKESMQKYK